MMRVAALLNSGADIHTLGGQVSHQQTHMPFSETFLVAKPHTIQAIFDWKMYKRFCRAIATSVGPSY